MLKTGVLNFVFEDIASSSLKDIKEVEEILQKGESSGKETAEPPRVDPRNQLNALTSKEWIPETVSVWTQRGLGAGHPDASEIYPRRCFVSAAEKRNTKRLSNSAPTSGRNTPHPSTSTGPSTSWTCLWRTRARTATYEPTCSPQSSGSSGNSTAGLSRNSGGSFAFSATTSVRPTCSTALPREIPRPVYSRPSRIRSSASGTNLSLSTP